MNAGDGREGWAKEKRSLWMGVPENGGGGGGGAWQIFHYQGEFEKRGSSELSPLRVDGRFVEIKRNFRKNQLHGMDQSSKLETVAEIQIIKNQIQF